MESGKNEKCEFSVEKYICKTFFTLSVSSIDCIGHNQLVLNLTRKRRVEWLFTDLNRTTVKRKLMISTRNTLTIYRE